MKTTVGLVCVVALCVGCETSKTNRVGFTREQASSVKTIGVIRPTNPEKVDFQNPKELATAEAIGGLIGVLATAPVVIAEANRQAKAFEEKAGSPHREFDQWMGKALEEQLSQAGYAVKLLDSGPRKSDAFLKNYASLATDVDALLDMRVAAFGFVKDPNRGVFVPWVSTPVQLVTCDGKKTLFRDWPIYGPDFIALGSAPTAKKYYFQDFDTILANPELALEGLRAGITNIASRVGEQLRPHSSGIHFYRKGSTYLYHYMEVVLKVDVDGRFIGTLGANQTLYAPLEPGTHKVRAVVLVGSAEYKETKVEVHLEANKDAYFQADVLVKMFQMTPPGVRLIGISDADGKAAVDKIQNPPRPSSTATGKHNL